MPFGVIADVAGGQISKASRYETGQPFPGKERGIQRDGINRCPFMSGSRAEGVGKTS